MKSTMTWKLPECLALFLAIFFSVCGNSFAKCAEDERSKKNLQYSHSVHAENATDLVYTTKITWNDTNDSTVGLLIKYEDVEEKSLRADRNTTTTLCVPIFHSGCNFDSKCSHAELDGKYFIVSYNGNDTRCNLPCRDKISEEISEELCSYLQKGYEVYSKNTRSITKRSFFGRQYRFHLIQYTSNSIVVDKIEPPPLFCRDTLISRFNFTESNSSKVCATQNISGSKLASGPASNVMESGYKVDIATNRGKITFRYRKPYDIVAGATFRDFSPRIEDCNGSSSYINGSKSQNGAFYFFEAFNLTLGQRFIFILKSDLLRSQQNQSGVPGVNHGQTVSWPFLIPDIDACNQTDPLKQYCDPNATCIDLPPASSRPALCRCEGGMSGNGISKNMSGGGEGCSYCTDTLCHPDATCLDVKDFTSRCSCPYLYFGDGLRNGSGCSHILLPLGISLGLLLCIIVTSLVTVRIRSARLQKIKRMELFYSKYLADDEYDERDLHSGIISDFLGKSLEITSDRLEFEEVIGRGSFGVVRKAKLRTESEVRCVAVKCIPDALDNGNKQAFLAEISLMSTVGEHPNIVTMIGLCSNDTCALGIVEEYMKYGDLLNFLWDARKMDKRQLDPVYNLTEAGLCDIAIQCIAGLKHLKQVKIIHGDVAARNVLVTENRRCKLSDFGLSADVYCVGKISTATELKLPLKWVSPERMMNGTLPITWRSDIWSFGVLLYEIVTLGASPYPEVPNDQIFNMLGQGVRMARPKTCGEEMYNVMTQCWQWEAAKRPSLESLTRQIRQIKRHAEHKSEPTLNGHV